MLLIDSLARALTVSVLTPAVGLCVWVAGETGLAAHNHRTLDPGRRLTVHRSTGLKSALPAILKEWTMAELKTKKTNASVAAFLNSIEDPQKRKDSKAIAKIMREITGEKPKMWGEGIVGYGSYHYRYASGQEGDWFLTGFSPRKQALTLYIMSGFYKEEPLLEKLGKFKTGKSCLYVKKLDDVDMTTLKQLIRRSVRKKAQMGAQ
jgi:hypothetical protein